MSAHPFLYYFSKGVGQAQMLHPTLLITITFY